jgi:zinc transport system permease protein
MRIVGVILIAALMVLPVSAGMRIAWSMRSALVLSLGVGPLSVLVGLTFAYYAELPPGGTIVLVAVAAVLAATLAGRIRPT